MTTFQALTDVVRSRWKAQIEDAQSIPTGYDNAPFNEPTDGSTWARFSVIPGESQQKSMGGTNRRFRTVGIGMAQIFTGTETGTKTSNVLINAIVTAFRGVTDTSVVFRTPSVVRVGRTGKWWQVNVICPFYADDFG